jgi:glycosyltransferase involved in cell wall biosynthesis
MRIGFSARGLSIRSGGARQFIKSLIPALARQKDRDELFVFYNQETFLGLASDCTEYYIKGDNKLLWDFARFPWAIRKLNLDAVIFPKNIIPFFTRSLCFPVIHDLAYFQPELKAYLLLDTLYMRAMIPQSVKRASGVFAVSEHTKKDIVHHTGCDPEKISVTYEAADEMYRPVTDVNHLKDIRQKYRDLPTQFILYTGSLSPRKNIATLLKAFSTLLTKIPHDLVLTGSKSWNDAAIHLMMKEPGLAGRICQLGYVDAEDMPALYSQAAAYVYPSLYEGFGLPVLEAMQCGCPVIASTATSIPEVAGKAALLVDPLDSGALAEAIHEVLTNNQFKNKLIRMGLDRAKLFSWDKCANAILKTIRDSVNKSTQ